MVNFFELPTDILRDQKTAQRNRHAVFFLTVFCEKQSVFKFQQKILLSCHLQLRQANYTGYAPFFVSASVTSTFFSCASLYLKKSVATCGNRA